ncbi:MAG: hypothetical protein MUO26_01170 [Methanotrichaceae archaeon]|nr:hypothetical protein [Methanotrichaceae archaeon]
MTYSRRIRKYIFIALGKFSAIERRQPSTISERVKDKVHLVLEMAMKRMSIQGGADVLKVRPQL